MNNRTIYVILMLTSVFISSVSQVLLKKSAMKTYSSHLKEYLNPYVICAYGLFFLATILTTLALRGLPLSMQPMLETTGYLYVAVMGYFLLKENFSKRKAAGLLTIILGILIYSI